MQSSAEGADATSRPSTGMRTRRAGAWKRERGRRFSGGRDSCQARRGKSSRWGRPRPGRGSFCTPMPRGAAGAHERARARGRSNGHASQAGLGGRRARRAVLCGGRHSKGPAPLGKTQAHAGGGAFIARAREGCSAKALRAQVAAWELVAAVCTLRYAFRQWPGAELLFFVDSKARQSASASARARGREPGGWSGPGGSWSAAKGLLSARRLQRSRDRDMADGGPGGMPAHLLVGAVGAKHRRCADEAGAEGRAASGNARGGVP